jgi:hypothetical protein
VLCMIRSIVAAPPQSIHHSDVAITAGWAVDPRHSKHGGCTMHDSWTPRRTAPVFHMR